MISTDELTVIFAALLTELHKIIKKLNSSYLQVKVNQLIFAVRII